jgi:uncharacterized protein (DUF2384 family)
MYKYPLYPTLNAYLYAMLGSTSLVDRWYESPNRAFELKRPIDVILSGNVGKAQVYKYVLNYAYR